MIGHDDLWRVHGACARVIVLRLLGLAAVVALDPDLWFPEQGSGVTARRICAGCPVRFDCLTYAIDNHEEFGIWGGCGELTRRHLRNTRDRRGATVYRIEIQDTFDRLDELAVTGAQPKGPAVVYGSGASHGRASTYGRGCRCEPCKAAKMDSLRRSAERQPDADPAA